MFEIDNYDWKFDQILEISTEKFEIWNDISEILTQNLKKIINLAENFAQNGDLLKTPIRILIQRQSR